MKIVYYSLTKQTQRFIAKLPFDHICLKKTEHLIEMNEAFILIVPSYDRDIVEFIDEFIEYGQNLKFIKGVAGNGNRNFATEFAKTAKAIAEKYQVPLLHCFEFSGTPEDVEKLTTEIRAIAER